MNVLIINHYALAPGGRSGSRHCSLGRAMVAKGHRVEIVAASFDHFAKTQRFRPPGAGRTWLEQIDGLVYRWVLTPAYRRNDLRRVWNILVFTLRLLRLPKFAADERPDVVIGSSFHPLAAVAAWWWAVRLRVPFVFEVRDLWPQTGIDLGYLTPWNPLSWLLYGIEGFLVRRAARILVLLPGGVDYFTHRYGEEAGRRTVWLPNGAEVAHFLALPPPPPRQAGQPLLALYFGAHGRPNELDQLIDAAGVLKRKRRSDIRLILVGDGTERRRLIERAEREGLDNVEFRPGVPKDEIPALAAEADVFVIPVSDSRLYRYGISANKIFEYLAAARPIVISYAGFANPVVEAAAGVTVPPRDPVSFAEALERIAAMTTDERRAMGEKGRRWVLAHHDYSVLAATPESTLQSVLAEAR